MDASSENASGNVEAPPPPILNQAPKQPLPPKSTKKRPSKPTSSMWDHFTKLEVSANVGARCKCNYCDKDYACATNNCGTSTLWKHLRNQCNKYPYKEQQKGQTTLTLVSASDEKGGNANNFVTTLFSQQACRTACAKMIIIDELHFLDS